MKYLLLLFIIVPVVEIYIFLLSSHTIGVFPTIFLIILTSVLGVYFAKTQGMKTMRKAGDLFRRGYPPGKELLDGVCIFLGGFFLIIPGFLSDVIGLFLLFPPTRLLIKPVLIKGLIKWFNGRRYIYFRKN